MRNKYYWNNFVMKKGYDKKLDANRELSPQNQSELQKMYEHFSLNDIYRERKKFFLDLNNKSGSEKLDNLLA